MSSGNRTDIADQNLMTSEYIGWELDFLQNSFYLPKQVLRNSKYEVKPIRVITGQQYAELVTLTTQSSRFVVIINEGANHRMLQKAVAVGVSERVADGWTYLICKIWYGNRAGKELV